MARFPGLLNSLSFGGSLLFFAVTALLTGLPLLRFSRSLPFLKKHGFLLWLTLNYAVLTFFQLGSLKAPVSAYQAQSEGEEAVIEVIGGDTSFDTVYTMAVEGDAPVKNGRYRVHYHGIRLSGSDDLNSWEEIAVLDRESYMKWDITETGPQKFRYLRLVFSEDSLLNEIALYNSQSGRFLTVESLKTPASDRNAVALTDEQDTVPEDPDYRDETYFDEIYHVRNAYEIVHRLPFYSAVHPLLGTRMIALGIRLFGMNPFGYRFCGALTSVLLIPVMHALAFAVFRKRKWADLSALLFACDFMHYTTGRIATLEPFSVLFILLMYLFMACFRNTDPYKQPFSAVFWLFLSGLSMACGWSVKWTAIYASAGLALIFFEHLIRSFRNTGCRERAAVTLMIVICCFFFFVILPIALYFLVYAGIRIYDAEPQTLAEHIRQVVDYIKYAFHYHAQLVDSHPYSSKWYMWLIDLRPIWYYVKYYGDSIRSISCFNNPLISFGGLTAILMLPWRPKDGRFPLLALTGYLSLLLPWVFVPRSAFAYHYYPCIPFLILLIVDLFASFEEGRKRRTALFVFTAAVILLFIAYLPVTGGFLSSRFYVTRVLPLVRGWWYFGG